MKIHRKQMVGGQTQNMMTHFPTNHTKYYHEAYLDEAGRDAGAGRDHGLETAVVYHEVTHCNIQISVRDAACLGTHRLWSIWSTQIFKIFHILQLLWSIVIFTGDGCLEILITFVFSTFISMP